MTQENETLRHFERDRARAWVEARGGNWDHLQWLVLLGELRLSGWLDLDPDSVGRVLERKKVEYSNLRHWRESGEAWRWVAARGGQWARHEWLTLLAGLQCWLGPIDADALDETLQRTRKVYQEWRRWTDTGAPSRFVEQRGGEWGHDEWQSLLAEVRESGYAALPADLIGLTLEEGKRTYWQRRRWEASGEPYRWVEARRGRFGRDDVLRLVASLERSPYWPLDVASVTAALERARRRYENLRQWERSGEAIAWVFTRGGEWTHEEWQSLLEEFAGEVEPTALGELLESLRDQYHGVQRWLDRRSGKEERVVFEDAAPVRRAA